MTPPTSSSGRYAEVAYHSVPHPGGDPDRLALVARLHGLEPPDIGTARVVELGCGDGGNLLAIAAARPKATLIGVDIEASAITRARLLAEKAGLERVRLQTADLLSLSPEGLGAADYVLVHGLWSWTPDHVRDAALGLAAAIVGANGVISITYNALPGWYLWMAARHIARSATRGEGDANRAAATAIEAVAAAADLHGQGDAYGVVLAAGAERLRKHKPWSVFHDELGDETTPFLVSEVAGRAKQHGLRYLGEGLLSDWWQWRLPSVTAERLRRDVDNPVERQQAADLISGVSFKSTLFVPEAARPSGEIDPSNALDLTLGPLIAGDTPASIGRDADMEALLSAVAPATSGALSRPLRQAAVDVKFPPEKAAEAALRLAARGHAMLRYDPPAAVAARPSEKPLASPLARAQARESTILSTLAHTPAEAKEAAVRALITLLDGSRSRDELVYDLVQTAPEFGVNVDGAVIDGMLDSILGKLSAGWLLQD